MNNATNRRNINGTMQPLPALAAQAANPACRRSNGERNQKSKSQKTYGDVATLLHILPHGRQVERLVGADVGEEVQADVEEREQTEHATKADEFRKLENLPQGRDGQSKNQKAQRPQAGRVLDKLDRVGAESALHGPVSERSKRRQADDKDHHLGPFVGKKSMHAMLLS